MQTFRLKDDPIIRRAFLFGVAVMGSALAWIIAGFMAGSLLPEHLIGLVVAGFYPTALILLSALMAFRILFSLPSNSPPWRAWGTFTAGITGIALGETLWLIQSLSNPLEVPGLGTVDDLFYLIGDLLLLLFFGMHFRFIKSAFSQWGWILIATLVAIYVVLTIRLAIIPIWMHPPEAATELAVAILYPILYMSILIGATAWTLALAGGWMTRSWFLINNGIWWLSFSVLLFLEADLTETYSWDQLNLPTIFHDLLYIFSFLLITIGLYVRMKAPLPEGRVDTIASSLPRTQLDEVGIVLSDDTGRVFFVDPRLPAVLGIPDAGMMIGEFAGRIFGLDASTEWRVLREAQSHGRSEPRPLVIAGQIYALQAAAEKGGSEVYWILTPWDARTRVRNLGIDALEQMLAASFRQPSAEQEAHAARYLQAVFRVLSFLCLHFGGPDAARGFVREFEPTLYKCLEGLYARKPFHPCQEGIRRAVEYAMIMMPPELVKEAIQRMENRLGPEAVEAAQRFGLRL